MHLQPSAILEPSVTLFVLLVDESMYRWSLFSSVVAQCVSV